VGLRYFHDHRIFDSDSTSFGFPAVDHGDGTFHSVDPRFNLRYEFSPTSMVYVNVAKGFRSGGFNLTSAGGGVFTVNKGITLLAITDGTSNTILVDELRIGPSANDIRGTWAMGQCGASISAGNGRTDTPTPNYSCDGCDDIQASDNRTDIGMGSCPGCDSWQVTAKSRHTGGVMTAFADGGVRFIRNSVSQSTWFLLHSRDDGQVLANDF